MKELLGKKIEKIDFDDDTIKCIHLCDGSILQFEAIAIGPFVTLDYLGIATKLKKGEQVILVETK